MKLTASEFISKAEGLKSSEISVRHRLESIRTQRNNIQEAIETQNFRLQSLYLELRSLESEESSSGEDGEGVDNSAEIAAIMSEISSTQEQIEDFEQQDSQLHSEEAEANSELRIIEQQEQETLADIQDSATRTNQNIALISSFGGDYANVSAQAASSFQHNLGQLSQAAQILGGSVSMGSSAASGNGSKTSSNSGTSQNGGSQSNFYESANNQRKASINTGTMGAKGSGSTSTGRNGRDIYTFTQSDEESYFPKKSGGLGRKSKGKSTQTPIQALSEYMNAHNYGKDDYAIYSQDPKWRVLQKAVNPNYPMIPLDQQTAKRLLSQYMSAHNYSKDDYAIYSKDPIWQELILYAYPEFADSYTKPNVQNFSSNYSSIVSSLNNSQVKHNSIVLSKQPRTTTEIINSLGGGDKTEGSCSSLAFAYVGNIAGYSVLDFRDGNSREFFSSNNSIKLIAELPGVKSQIIYGKDDIRCATELLNSMIPEKEYYLATGQHASIVRKIDDHFEYLELQSAWNNGWHSLDASILANRFGCDTNNQHEYPNFLIDAQSLSQNKEFLDVLGYINTAESNQMKGESGNVK